MFLHLERSLSIRDSRAYALAVRKYERRDVALARVPSVFLSSCLAISPNQQLPENHFHLSLFLKIPGAALACHSAMILKLGQGELSYSRSPCTRKRT